SLRALIRASSPKADAVVLEPARAGSPARRSRLWIAVAGGSLAVLLLAAAGVAYWLQPGPDKLEDPAALLPHVDAALQNFTCAHLTARIVAPNVEVSGYLGSDADVAQLATRFAALKGARQVINRATLRKWPLCEELDILREQTISDPQTNVTPQMDL